MKKGLMIALIIGFVWVGNAAADETICGFCEVTYMEVYKSQPCDGIDCGEFIRPCEVGFIFTSPNQQVYDLFGRAYGTALNLALLKAGNFGETVSCCFTFRFVPGFDIEIDKIDFVFPGNSG